MHYFLWFDDTIVAILLKDGVMWQAEERKHWVKIPT